MIYCGRMIRLLIKLFFFSFVALPSSVFASPRVKVDEQSHALIDEKNMPVLEVHTASPAELISALRIYTGNYNEKNFDPAKIAALDRSRKKAVLSFNALANPFKKLLLQKLWPKDKIEGDFWIHHVSYSSETLWKIAEIWTGKGASFKEIMRASKMNREKVVRGVRIKIPINLLIPALQYAPPQEMPKLQDPLFVSQTPVAEEQVIHESAKIPNTRTLPIQTKPTSELELAPKIQETKSIEETRTPERAESTSENADVPEPTFPAQDNDEALKQIRVIEELRSSLSWGKDKKGKYAIYRLKPGEAIYSSVVIRFCGLVSAAEVNALAKVIIARNEIKDEKDLAVNTSIKIPYESLEPAFREASDPEYTSYINNLRDLSKISTSLRTKNLEGVRIILDPGHGGRDPGAIFGTVWEDDYVYDIACRIKTRLERESSAMVITTVFDPSSKYQPQDVANFEMDDDEYLLTQPNFKLNGERAISDGVNLRWVYANHWFDQWVKEGIKPENVLFASIHADSLHPSLRGKMIYVPDAQNYPRNISSPRNFRQYQEYSSGQFSFNQDSMQQAQARSMNFAHILLDSDHLMGIQIHTQRPVRSMIYRNRNKPFVPAVIRFNRVPTRCLVEVCNLSNKDDRELMRNPEFRQRVADAFVDATYKAFGAQPNKTVSLTPPLTKSKVR